MSLYYYVLDVDVDQCTINVKSGFPVPIVCIDEHTGNVFGTSTIGSKHGHVVVGNIFYDQCLDNIEYHFDLNDAKIQLYHISTLPELSEVCINRIKETALKICLKEVNKEIDRLETTKKALEERKNETWTEK